MAYLGVGIICQGDRFFPASGSEAEINGGAIEVYLIQEGIWIVFSAAKTSRCQASKCPTPLVQ